MSRYDKYDPVSGGFRAPLAAAFTGGASGVDFGKMFAVSLNASGQVVFATPNTSVTGFVGVMILHEAKAAGQVVDIMTAGEIVEFTLANGAAAAAGTVYYTNAAGDGGYSATGPAGATIGRIGHTVEAGRLIVRVVAGAKAA